MWRLGGGDRARARRVGPQLTYLISHVHANGAGLTRPVQTLPERGEKKASQVATAWGHCCPGQPLWGTRPPWPPHGWPSAHGLGVSPTCPRPPGSEQKEDTEHGDGQHQPPPGRALGCCQLCPGSAMRESWEGMIWAFI